MKRENVDRSDRGTESIRGLSVEDVRRRRAKGLVNRAPSFTSRPVGAILRGNFLTLFNAILLTVLLLLLVVGQVRDAILTGGLVVFTVAVSTIQELRAKVRLDRIALLARVRVRVIREGQEQEIDPAEIVLGDYLVLRRGEQTVVDGHLVLADGLEMDESLLTGEAEPMSKSAGQPVLSGSFCVAGFGVYVAERIGEASYIQRLTEEGRRYRNPRTPLQHLLNRVLRILLTVVVGLSVLQITAFLLQGTSLIEGIRATAVLVTLVPQGLLLTSTVAYTLGALRVAEQGALIQQLNSVESLSHVDLLCLDKTGTLTRGKLALREVVPAEGREKEDIARLVGSVAASFPEPTAIMRTLAQAIPASPCRVRSFTPFSSERRWSAVALTEPCTPGVYVLGAPEVLLQHVRNADALSEAIARHQDIGQRVLLFAVARDIDSLSAKHGEQHLPHSLEPLGFVAFEEELRPDAPATLAAFAGQGVTLKLLSGDSPKTVLALARRAGFSPEAEAISGAELADLPPDEFARTVGRFQVFGRVTPQQKREIIRTLKAQGHYVAMIGDGVNDVPALKEANLGVAMRSGSQAARAAADLVLLNDSFAVLPSVLGAGRRVVNGLMLAVKLFLVRDLATIELILASGFFGAPFPLFPPQTAVIAFLTVGVPTIFIVVWAGEAVLRPGSLREAAEFVLWVGTTSSMAILTVYLLALSALGMGVGPARTAAVSAAVVSGLVVLILLDHPLDAPIKQLLGNRRVLVLAGTMLLLYLGVLYLPVGQRYFELQPLAFVGWLVTLPSVALWFGLLWLQARYRFVERMLG